MLKNFLDFLWKRKIVLIVLLVIIAAGVYFGLKQFQTKPIQYQTAAVTKGNLITTVTASGQITNGSSVSITTQSSGVIKDVLVKDGDKVTTGQVIATLTLDQASQQKQASAWASYLQAKNSLNSANNQLNTLQNSEFVANQKFINDAVARGLAANDPTYIEENATWLAAEQDYKNQQNVIAQAQQSLNSSALAYQQTAATITSPITGTVSGLIIAPGSAITSSSSGSSSTTSSTSIGSVIQPGPIQAQVNLSEIDSVNVDLGQKVTLALDAFSDKTFTGKVMAINTNGVVSSGVTTYPAIIALDTKADHIYPNMAVNSHIITNVYDNVLLVPSTAIQTQNGATTVRVLKNGQVQSVPVVVGNSSDTQTIITSGLSEGDSVVIGIVSTGTTSSGAASSPFGIGGGRGGFGGGGAVRVGGGRGG